MTSNTQFLKYVTSLQEVNGYFPMPSNTHVPAAALLVQDSS